MKTIKIAKVPGGVKEIAVEAGATVSEILNLYCEEFGQTTDGFEARVNDEKVGGDAVVEDGAKIYLVKMVKGNLKTVKIAKVPGGVKELAVDDDATVGEVLNLYCEEFGQSTEGFEARVNDEKVSDASTVSDGDKIYLVKMVKGNN